MSSVEERLVKLREERLAREKARIEKLRELNLKKYNKNEPQQKHSVSNVSIVNKTRSEVANKSSIPSLTATKNVKNNFHVNGTTKRPISATLNRKTDVKDVTIHHKTNLNKNVIKKDVMKDVKEETVNHKTHFNKNVIKKDLIKNKTERPVNMTNKPTLIPKAASTVTNSEKIIKKDIAPSNVNESVRNPKINNPSTNKVSELNRNFARKSLAPKSIPKQSIIPRKSIQPPKIDKQDSKVNSRESVFDRLYKPKMVNKKQPDEVTKLQTDPNYLKKVLKDSSLILNNKRHTVFDFKTKQDQPVRRSISAVHFKRISKNEINNCIHKWSSIGEKLDKIHLTDIDEDESVKADKVISAVKSERKKVKFQTPVPSNFNTPRPEELQSRLKSWLQKRGKSLDSYHHLQCFGIHHISQRVKPLEVAPQYELYDDEDKENIAVEHDSDNDSYTINNMNDEIGDLDNGNCMNLERDKWRRASYVSDSGDLNETRDTVCSGVTSSDLHPVDDVLMGALYDLTDLLREGFDWEQCARWLRAVRERFPGAPAAAAYWECRAALEDRRGDLPASVQCWEEAIAKGTERSVVEANLDQLLDKFMQLKISPNSGKTKRADPKMLDVKNVFKSTIIRFAVQQAKLRNSNEPAKYTVTPVRRSSRLSMHGSARRTPLQVCTSIRRADLPGPVVFVPNDKLCETP